MAVTAIDESLHHATEALILKSPRKHFRAFMHAEHWQLRSLISSPNARIVYYPHGPDLYRLDTCTHEREYVATIPFTPKCLAAADGWISCGGDHGNFATIPILPREGFSDLLGGARGETDSRLPLDLGPAPRSEHHDRSHLSIERRRGGYLLLERSASVGEELVNCITIWIPGSASSEQSYKRPVAVLSSNDQSVTVIDLETRQALDKLELDDCVNRASISPDGRLLIAIGDDPYMHVFERKQKHLDSRGFFKPKTNRQFEWVKCRRIHLESQQSEDKSEMRGSFAMAFAPSGRYLAVGTQYGIISVFETSRLTDVDADPLYVSFTTSRPHSKHGAVRDMEFSPAPYDLLAWTEDHRRVAIADIRKGFMSRQVLVLDPRGDGVEMVDIIERSDDIVIDPRLRQFRMGSEGNTSESVAAEMERRQLRHLSREGLDRMLAPLTSEETEVLEALQVSRRHRERDISRQSSASNSLHAPLAWSDSVDDFQSSRQVRTGGQGAFVSAGNDPNLRSSGLPATLREYISRSRSNDSLRTETLRAFIHERNQERERRGQAPRRRGSLILAAAGTSLNRDFQENGDAQRSAAWGLATTREPVTSTLPRLPTARSDSPGNNPWAEIEALYTLAVEPPVIIDPSSRMRIEVTSENRRELTRRLEQRARGYLHREEASSRLDHGDSSASSNTNLEVPETTGCCWSKDGKVLYVGAEHGIYEYHVNIMGRKTFPSVNFL